MLPSKSAEYQRSRLLWQHKVCSRLAAMRERHMLNDTQRRQTYLLCRGPVYTFSESRESSVLYEELQSIYTDSRICVPTQTYKAKTTDNLTDVEETISNFIKSIKEYIKTEGKQGENSYIDLSLKIALETKDDGKALCMRGEPDLEKLMSYSRNEEVLRWAWLVWREKIGPPMRKPYLDMVKVLNKAARRNGYNDIGESWRDELETPNLRQFCRQLYKDIRLLYTMLHGVIRHYLRKAYGNIVPEFGPIPAHLLGNMWSQNWEDLIDIIKPNSINLNKNIKQLNWTVLHMVKRAEDFYQSLGFPPMTDQFWKNSMFTSERNDTRCHGAAADMFKNGDYRLLYCSGTSAEDFYVIHHEMGHIQYYMSYENQPGIFRQGANSAFQESIGDTIMYGVLTPQHLHRLGLINDSYLYNDVNTISKTKEIEDTEEFIKTEYGDSNYIPSKTFEEDIDITKDELLLLKIGLNKIPQIPFALLIDEYRWQLFEGNIKEKSINKVFWELSNDIQGIAPPGGERGESYFDIGAKYHVPDNTPYVRYYLSHFLQLQLFESLCKASVLGRRGMSGELPDSMSLNRCDVYGSKVAGKILKDILTKGSSQHWRKILESAIGTKTISARSLNEYYLPLKKLLKRLISSKRIPLGW